jgi:hypothetical protein
LKSLNGLSLVKIIAEWPEMYFVKSFISPPMSSQSPFSSGWNLRIK